MSLKKGPNSLIGITLNLLTDYHYAVIFIILTLTQYHQRSFSLLVPSQFFLFSVLRFIL